MQQQNSTISRQVRDNLRESEAALRQAFRDINNSQAPWTIKRQIAEALDTVVAVRNRITDLDNGITQ